MLYLRISFPGVSPTLETRLLICVLYQQGDPVPFGESLSNDEDGAKILSRLLDKLNIFLVVKRKQKKKGVGASLR